MKELLIRVFQDVDGFCAVTGDEAISGTGTSPAAALRALAIAIERAAGEANWTQDDDETEIVADLNDLETSLNSLVYYLYRLAGCPYGSTFAGLMAWVDTSIAEPFEQFCISTVHGQSDEGDRDAD